MVSRDKAAVTGIFRRMQASFVTKLPCSGTRKKGRFVSSVNDKPIIGPFRRNQNVL